MISDRKVIFFPFWGVHTHTQQTELQVWPGQTPPACPGSAGWWHSPHTSASPGPLQRERIPGSIGKRKENFKKKVLYTQSKVLEALLSEFIENFADF